MTPVINLTFDTCIQRGPKCILDMPLKRISRLPNIQRGYDCSNKLLSLLIHHLRVIDIGIKYSVIISDIKDTLEAQSVNVLRIVKVYSVVIRLQLPLTQMLDILSPLSYEIPMNRMMLTFNPWDRLKSNFLIITNCRTYRLFVISLMSSVSVTFFFSTSKRTNPSTVRSYLSLPVPKSVVWQYLRSQSFWRPVSRQWIWKQSHTQTGSVLKHF